jgi:hypothetical protein
MAGIVQTIKPAAGQDPPRPRSSGEAWTRTGCDALRRSVTWRDRLFEKHRVVSA